MECNKTPYKQPTGYPVSSSNEEIESRDPGDELNFTYISYFSSLVEYFSKTNANAARQVCSPENNGNWKKLAGWSIKYNFQQGGLIDERVAICTNLAFARN